MKTRQVAGGVVTAAGLVVGLGVGIFWLRPVALPPPPSRAEVAKSATVVAKTVVEPHRAAHRAAPENASASATSREGTRAALEQLETLADLPGARPLVQDIRRALEENPDAIDLTAITEPDGTLRPDYLERMIPDPELREKWVALLDLALTDGER